MPKEAAERLIEAGLAIGISSVGGMAHYIYKHLNGMPFQFTKFVMNAALAGFVGWMIGASIPDTYTIRDAIIGISGFSSLHILGFVENGGWRMVFNVVLRAFNLPQIPENRPQAPKKPEA